ncbi:MAG TPA: site-2 protease family protein [Candidatus Peribacteraceae bacterium]|nr:site-2 protease family protein [Candidatus Peribacteraceae bacterium]
MTSFLNPTYIIAVLIAISVHEWAHAFVASRFGDPTPGQNGRLTLNPIAHLDLLGAIMFLVIGFGWAKPVPVDSRYFRHPKRDLSLVALAGPFSNLVLAFISFLLLLLVTHGNGFSLGSLLSNPTGPSPAWTILIQILNASLFVNLALMAFNLFPVAPLDGSNIVRQFIPYQYEERYEDFVRIGPYILIGLIVAEMFLPIHILSAWVFGIMQFVLNIFNLI